MRGTLTILEIDGKSPILACERIEFSKEETVACILNKIKKSLDDKYLAEYEMFWETGGKHSPNKMLALSSRLCNAVVHSDPNIFMTELDGKSTAYSCNDNLRWMSNKINGRRYTLIWETGAG